MEKDDHRNGRLLAGHTAEAQVIVMGRDIEFINDRLKKIEEVADKLEPLGEMLPQLREMLEARRRTRWILKAIGAFLMAAPAVAVIMAGFSRLMEWIRGQ